MPKYYFDTEFLVKSSHIILADDEDHARAVLHEALVEITNEIVGAPGPDEVDVKLRRVLPSLVIPANNP